MYSSGTYIQFLPDNTSRTGFCMVYLTDAEIDSIFAIEPTRYKSVIAQPIDQ